jgi:hypothetical protein
LGWRGIFTHPVGAGYNPDAPIGANAKNKNSTDILQKFQKSRFDKYRIKK